MCQCCHGIRAALTGYGYSGSRLTASRPESQTIKIRQVSWTGISLAHACVIYSTWTTSIIFIAAQNPTNSLTNRYVTYRFSMFDNLLHQLPQGCNVSVTRSLIGLKVDQKLKKTSAQFLDLLDSKISRKLFLRITTVRSQKRLFNGTGQGGNSGKRLWGFGGFFLPQTTIKMLHQVFGNTYSEYFLKKRCIL